ncbi:hypothetical protein [Bacillus sp. 165]|uniref:hypothetical protein n=1 Tax=Bacillus sp. 165 TaxID=1529117 RepID=UPI001ADCD8DB|nr:hypothetical protein [Bacillus sp. 165]MBO9130758.1 hypothetical protein [Bacillus sp. 165]
MSHNTIDFYNTLKKLGFQLEQQANELIHNQVNKEEIFEFVTAQAQSHSNTIKQLHELIEILSVQFNFPTKTDAANIAKLIIQVEEKLDMMEEHILYLMDSVEELKQHLPNEEITRSFLPLKPSHNRLKEIQSQLIMNVFSQINAPLPSTKNTTEEQ